MSLSNVHYITFKSRSTVHGFGCLHDKVGPLYMLIIVDETEQVHVLYMELKKFS